MSAPTLVTPCSARLYHPILRFQQSTSSPTPKIEVLHHRPHQIGPLSYWNIHIFSHFEKAICYKHHGLGWTWNTGKKLEIVQHFPTVEVQVSSQNTLLPSSSAFQKVARTEWTWRSTRKLRIFQTDIDIDLDPHLDMSSTSALCFGSWDP